MKNSTGRRSRLRFFERDVELELEPLELRDTIGVTLIFASLCVVSYGGVLFFGGTSWRIHGETAWTGLWLILGGGTAFSLVIWRLQPHKSVKHASHRFRHHARKLRPRRVAAGPAMTDAQVDAIEDAWTDTPEQRHQTAGLETDRSHARR